MDYYQPDLALVAMAAALRPGGVLAIDVCDLEWGTIREGAENYGRVGPDYAVITEFSTPAPDKFGATSPRSCPTAPGPGGAAASTTRTCSWTPRASRPFWP